MGERHDQPATTENLELTAHVTSVASPPANGRVAGCRSVGTERTSCAEWTIGWYRMWISPLAGTRRTPTVGASRHCQIASPTLTVQAAGLDSGGGSKSAALRIQEAAMAARPLRATVRRGDKTRGHRRVFEFSLVFVLAGLLSPSGAWANPEKPAAELLGAALSETQLDPSGIELVSKVTQARPTSAKQAQAFDDAMQFASSHPSDFGYPWIDPASGTLELSAATSKATALLAATPEIGQSGVIRDVPLSFGQLEEI